MNFEIYICDCHQTDRTPVIMVAVEEGSETPVCPRCHKPMSPEHMIPKPKINNVVCQLDLLDGIKSVIKTAESLDRYHFGKYGYHSHDLKLIIRDLNDLVAKHSEAEE